MRRTRPCDSKVVNLVIIKSSRKILSFTRRKIKSFRTAPPKKKVSKDQLEADKQDEKVEAIQVNNNKHCEVLVSFSDTYKTLWK